ncbi:MAG: SDR family NAD(P)-dependent oxidoreductase [Rhodospirillales bacterium]|nr:SDR family NAD(P)-dependent oxidoreductase [Rhodospirillales bacterium]MCB9996284.1 SDR family NAD(P)-dependent oxidoreductase [Rhodospirillales bacterium]
MSNDSRNIDLSGRVALVTGASRGIGRAVALAYAKAGAHVVALARTTGALEELDDEISKIGGSATLIPQDILVFDKLDMLGPALADKFGKLDIFVGNAGVLGTLGPLSHLESREWQKVMDVNLTANYRLIRTLEPLLKASDAGRMIFTSSGLAQKPFAYWAAYCASKAGLEMMVKTYAAEIETTNIKANLVDPGIVDTAMLESAFPGGFPGETCQPEDVVPAYLRLAVPDCAQNGAVVIAADYFRQAA